MSRTYKDSPNSRNHRLRSGARQRNISVRAVRRDPPDLRKLSRALINLAVTEATANRHADDPDVAATPQTTAGKDADD